MRKTNYNICLSKFPTCLNTGSSNFHVAYTNSSLPLSPSCTTTSMKVWTIFSLYNKAKQFLFIGKVTKKNSTNTKGKKRNEVHQWLSYWKGHPKKNINEETLLDRVSETIFSYFSKHRSKKRSWQPVCLESILLNGVNNTDFCSERE